MVLFALLLLLVFDFQLQILKCIVLNNIQVISFYLNYVYPYKNILASLSPSSLRKTHNNSLSVGPKPATPYVILETKLPLRSVRLGRTMLIYPFRGCVWRCQGKLCPSVITRAAAIAGPTLSPSPPPTELPKTKDVVSPCVDQWRRQRGYSYFEK